MLLVRIFEINPLVCRGCGGEMYVIKLADPLIPLDFTAVQAGLDNDQPMQEIFKQVLQLSQKNAAS